MIGHSSIAKVLKHRRGAQSMLGSTSLLSKQSALLLADVLSALLFKLYFHLMPVNPSPLFLF
jgi:hypothetical protein